MALNEKMPSSFYPPRARWYAKIFYLGHATRHRLALDRLQLPRDITLSGIIGGLLVPGLAVYLRGPRLFGQLALMASVLLLFGFIVGMGYPLGNYAFGLMISVHVSGFAYYCSPFLREKEFKVRIAFTLLLLVGMGLCLYLPFRNLIQGHWFLPLLRNRLPKNLLLHLHNRNNLLSQKLLRRYQYRGVMRSSRWTECAG